LAFFLSVNYATLSVAFLIQFFRASVVSLTYYAVYIVKSATEGNTAFNFFGGVVPFLAIASVGYLGVTIFVIRAFRGKLRMGLLILLCVLTAVDFINDLSVVLTGTGVLPF
jgi:hypothetical protein